MAQEEARTGFNGQDTFESSFERYVGMWQGETGKARVTGGGIIFICSRGDCTHSGRPSISVLIKSDQSFLLPFSGHLSPLMPHSWMSWLKLCKITQTLVAVIPKPPSWMAESQGASRFNSKPWNVRSLFCIRAPGESSTLLSLVSFAFGADLVGSISDCQRTSQNIQLKKWILVLSLFQKSSGPYTKPITSPLQPSLHSLQCY